ncbi:PAS domain S-box protein [candidate division KSB1 bacterium]
MSKPTYEELKNRIKELEKKEEELRAKEYIINSASSIIATSDLDGIVTYINPYFLKIWEFDHTDEIIGKHFSEFWIVYERLDEIISSIKENNYWSGDIKAKKKNGTIFDVHVNASTIYDTSGKPIGLMSTSIDITDSKQAEEELQKLASVVQYSSDLINLATLDGNMIFINEAGSKMLGIDNKEVEKTNIMQVIPDHLKEKVQSELLPTLMENRTWEGELQYLNLKTGALTDVYVVSFMITDPVTGEQLYLANVSKDITERKKVEDALLQSEEKFRKLSESSPIGIFQTDNDGRVVYLNDRWCSITKMTREDALDFGWASAIHPEDKAKILEEWDECLKMNKGYSGEFRFIRPNGEVRWVYTRTSPISSADGNVIGHVGTNVDITERKKAEDALRESEEDLQYIMQNVKTGIVVHASDTSIIQSNHTAQNILGLTEDQLLGKMAVDPEWKFLREDGTEMPVEEYPVNLVLKHKKLLKDYVVGIKSAGNDENKWTLVNAAPKLGKNNSISEIIVDFMDITERRRAEGALRQSEELLNVTQKLTKIGCWKWDIKNQIMFWTDETYRIHEINPHDIETGSTEHVERSLKCYDEKDRPIIVEAFNKCVAEGKSYDMEFPFTNFKRKKLWIRTTAKAEKEHGKVVGVIGNIMDITDRKKIEEELSAERQRLADILKGTNAGTWDWNVQTSELTLNDRWAEILGYKLEELEPIDIQTWIKNVHPDDLPVANALLEKHFKREADYYDVEFRQPHKNGSWVWVNARGKVVKWTEDGKPLRMSGTHLDITERKQLEEQLQIRQRMDSLGTLAGGIAHDFNNMLVGIMGNIDLLLFDKHNLTENQKKYLEDAEKSCERAKELIQQFHSFSKVSIAERRSIDFYDVAMEVTSLLSKTTDKLIDKRVGFKKGEYYIKANPTELNQVFMNLGINAAHAIEKKGVQTGDYICINAEDYKTDSGDTLGLSEGDYIHIIFEDNGIGMSEEVLRRAFDPLFTTKDKGGVRGQGLGLSMVFNIVTRIHNGHISIESEEGSGTKFHLYLPKAQSESAFEEKRMIDIPGGNETILVVDDEKTVRKLAESMLTTFGYKVLTAVDGQQALEKYQEQKDSIDAVILDLTMPIMSGEMLLRRMLDINPDVKVIISSGHSDEYTKEGILAEAKSQVGKPYKMKDLAQTVRSVLDM